MQLWQATHNINSASTHNIIPTHPFRSPCVDDPSATIQAEPQHSLLSTKHTIQWPITAPIGVYGIRLPTQHGLTAQHLSLTLFHVVGHNATVFTVSHVESVLGSIQGQLVRDKEKSAVNGILPCLEELASYTELEDTPIAIAVR